MLQVEQEIPQEEVVQTILLQNQVEVLKVAQENNLFTRLS